MGELWFLLIAAPNTLGQLLLCKWILSIQIGLWTASLPSKANEKYNGFYMVRW